MLTVTSNSIQHKHVKLKETGQECSLVAHLCPPPQLWHILIIGMVEFLHRVP